MLNSISQRYLWENTRKYKLEGLKLLFAIYQPNYFE